LGTQEDENKTLRQYLDFFKDHHYEHLMSNVISVSGINDPDQYVIIDKGAEEGIIPGLIAVNEQGIAIGKVEEVEGDISRIILSSANKCKFAATIGNKERTKGITQGELGLTIKMDYIPLTETIMEGEVVMTSGLEKNIPRGIVIGRVTEIEKANNELWQSALIEPLVSSGDLLMAAVIMP
jgi:rod shape-determining protein MreC